MNRPRIRLGINHGQGSSPHPFRRCFAKGNLRALYNAHKHRVSPDQRRRYRTAQYRYPPALPRVSIPVVIMSGTGRALDATRVETYWAQPPPRKATGRFVLADAIPLPDSNPNLDPGGSSLLQSPTSFSSRVAATLSAASASSSGLTRSVAATSVLNSTASPSADDGVRRAQNQRAELRGIRRSHLLSSDGSKKVTKHSPNDQRLSNLERFSETPSPADFEAPSILKTSSKIKSISKGQQKNKVLWDSESRLTSPLPQSLIKKDKVNSPPDDPKRVKFSDSE